MMFLSKSHIHAAQLSERENFLKYYYQQILKAPVSLVHENMEQQSWPSGTTVFLARSHHLLSVHYWLALLG